MLPSFFRRIRTRESIAPLPLPPTPPVPELPPAAMLIEPVVRLVAGPTLIVGNRQALKQRVLDELVAGGRHFTIDFRDCAYIDASGLGVLVSIAKKIRDVDGSLVLEGLNADLLVLLELTKIDTLFTLRDAA